MVPQFVLKELQQIAGSSDPLKRNRGRRGLDILQRIQKSFDLEVRIVDHDFPQIRDVDAKLVALGKTLKGKVLTNDFNLNKVAELQGVPVLNINLLANAVKPVMLPGEVMNVYVMREGKEYGQGRTHPSCKAPNPGASPGKSVRNCDVPLILAFPTPPPASRSAERV